MTRRALVFLSLVGLVACSGEPSAPSNPVRPDFLISDASHLPGRPDFGWRPPIANTSIGGTFDATRHPTVRICVLNVVDNACTGADVFTAADVPVVLSNYQVNWLVPVDPAVVYYRIFAQAGSPAVILGFADVKTGTNKSLKGNTPIGFVAAPDGSTLPIKFRINTFCATNDCGGGFIDTQQGGTAFFTEAGVTTGGIIIPPQPGGEVVTVNITPCTTGNLPIDIPLFGSCLTVETLPADIVLEVPGTVFVCDAELPVLDLDPDQRPLVTLHRKDGSGVQALPHADDLCPTEGLTIGSVKGLLRALAHGEWKSARGQLFSLLAPRPLYARRLDAGAGGQTSEFSDFQFALPAYMEIVAATNNQFALPGAILNPTVLVKDLNGDPVGGATVRFLVLTGGGSPAVEVTDPSDPTTGLASTPWTLGAVAGSNTLKASGFGIAGPGADNVQNGPREGVDPFIPLRQHPPEFTDGTNGPAVTLGTGELTFTATGTVLFGSAFSGLNGPATLYAIDPSTGTATAIGTGIGFNRVGAMDFHPTTGVLYATGQNSDNTPLLITIDVTTGAGAEVGPTGISGNIADVSFRSDGTLFAYDATVFNHTLYTVNLTTGAASLVGSTGLSSNGGNGIGIDGAGVLYHSNRDFSHTLSQTAGTATVVAAISPNPDQTFPSECAVGNGLRVAADDLDPGSNVFFGAIKCGGTPGTPAAGSDWLGTVDYLSGVITLIGPTVSNLDGLAVGPSGCGLCVDVSGSLMGGSSVKPSNLIVGPLRSRSNQPAARGPRAALSAKPVQWPRQ